MFSLFFSSQLCGCNHLAKWCFPSFSLLRYVDVTIWQCDVILLFLSSYMDYSLICSTSCIVFYRIMSLREGVSAQTTSFTLPGFFNWSSCINPEKGAVMYLCVGVWILLLDFGNVHTLWLFINLLEFWISSFMISSKYRRCVCCHPYVSSSTIKVRFRPMFIFSESD